MRKIANIYVSITCICHKFIDSSISGSNSEVIMPTTVLVSLEIHNGFFSDVYMEDIADIKCQIRHLHLEQYYIEQKNDQNFQLLR